MLLGEIVQVALEALRANKLRSLLTMLGIIIGVGAVITMLALGSGAEQSVRERLQALGPTLLTVYPGQSFHHGVASDNRVSLTMDDDTALANSAHYVTDVVPELRASLQVQKGNRNINVNVLGTTPGYVPVKNYTITAGRMFTAGDDAARRRVAVLGSAVPTMLDVTPAAMIGQEIAIRGIPFDIMGTDRLRSITVKAADLTSMNLAMIEIERVLRRQHKIRPGRDDDFQIRNQTDILATLQHTTETFKYLLAGIAAVSLLVGGIGIMNIMLVSVTERTREIGVRKALGATRFNILFQFLVEALVLCLVGGLIGVVIGSFGALVLSKLAHWNTLISPLAILLAFVFSAAVGLFFGIWPARRAASLDPIDALRYE